MINPRKIPTTSQLPSATPDNAASKRSERSRARDLPTRVGRLLKGGRLGGIGTPATSTAVISTPTTSAGIITSITGIISIASIRAISAPTAAASVSASTNANVAVLKVRISLEFQVGRRGTLRDIGLQEIGDFLVGLDQGASKNRCNRLIPIRVEGRSQATVANATSPTCEC